MAEIALAVAVLASPILIGAVLAYAGRPWWWGAIVSIALFVVAAVAPEPEEGESRLALGDLGFLAVVALFVAALTWLGFLAAGRRLSGSR